MTVDCSKERNAEETIMQAKQDLPLLHLDPPPTPSILLTPLMLTVDCIATVCKEVVW